MGLLQGMIVTGFLGPAAATGKVAAAGRLGKYKSACQYQIGTFLILLHACPGSLVGGVYFYYLRCIFFEPAQ